MTTFRKYDRHLVYDGSCQAIIQVTETDIGPQYINICEQCNCRTRGDVCPDYARCLTAKDKENAPYSNLWTHWTIDRLNRDFDIMAGKDPVTGYTVR